MQLMNSSLDKIVENLVEEFFSKNLELLKQKIEKLVMMVKYQTVT